MTAKMSRLLSDGTVGRTLRESRLEITLQSFHQALETNELGDLPMPYTQCDA